VQDDDVERAVAREVQCVCHGICVRRRPVERDENTADRARAGACGGTIVRSSPQLEPAPDRMWRRAAARTMDQSRKGGTVATTVKWTPLRELDAMERRMRRMLEDVGFTPTLLPAADVYETPGEFVVELDLPAYEQKELGIEVSDHTLIVTGERKEAKEETDKTYLVRERLARVFERRFLLPTEADTKHLTASFEKGVLKVHAPKAVEAKRKIPIDAKPKIHIGAKPKIHIGAKPKIHIGAKPKIHIGAKP
jgi:HSP20 family molecular chaperone IbpA